VKKKRTEGEERKWTEKMGEKLSRNILIHILIHAWLTIMFLLIYVLDSVSFVMFVCSSLYSLLPDLWWIKLFEVLVMALTTSECGYRRRWCDQLRTLVDQRTSNNR